jgi:WD40 repeat protein
VVHSSHLRLPVCYVLSNASQTHFFSFFSRDGAFVQTLEPLGGLGPSGVTCFRTLAVGLDGKVFAGSLDRTINVWSGESGAPLHTLTLNDDDDDYDDDGDIGDSGVCSFAVGSNGVLYSGSASGSILAWK